MEWAGEAVVVSSGLSGQWETKIIKVSVTDAILSNQWKDSIKNFLNKSIMKVKWF